MKNMKKFIYFLAALPLAGITACSQDDQPLPANPASAVKSEIAFAPTFDRSTRAATSYDSNHIPDQFTVGAFHFDSLGYRKPFFTGDKYVKSGSDWVNSTGTRYWPDGGSNDFYALVFEKNPDAADHTVNWKENPLPLGKQVVDGKTIDVYQYMTKDQIAKAERNGQSIAPAVSNYTISNDARNQYDLLYAVTKGRTKDMGTIPLNFRHALTQVVFNAMNVSPNIYVEISGVSIGNLCMECEVDLPDATTSPSTVSDSTTWASWVQRPNTYRQKSYAQLDSVVGIPGNTDETIAPTHLTDNGNSLAMLLVPSPIGNNQTMAGQKTGHLYFPYQPNTSKPMLGKGGNYIGINCTIWAVADPSKGHVKTEDVELWGGKDGTPKELLVPVDISNWRQGKKFTYTLLFGKGNAGFNPENDTPVLAPLTFSVTVDDMVDVVNDKITLPNV